jgi:hypothetical protein
MTAFFAKLPPCLIGMEACATAHHWARTLVELGHDVRLISPAYVKPFVKRHKNDAADAAAICEAVVRPSMRFVPVKSKEQQATLMLHNARELLISQRTALMNALRGHFAELGIVVAQGARNVGELILILETMDQSSNRQALPDTMRLALQPLANALIGIEAEIAKLDKEILALHRKDDVCLRLASIPVSGQLQRRFCRRVFRIRACSRVDESSRHSWGWCLDNIRAAASQSSDGFPKWATGICESYWWSERMPRSTASRTARPNRRWPTGQEPCWRRSHSSWSPSLWPIRWRASHGRS